MLSERPSPEMKIEVAVVNQEQLNLVYDCTRHVLAWAAVLAVEVEKAEAELIAEAVLASELESLKVTLPAQALTSPPFSRSWGVQVR